MFRISYGENNLYLPNPDWGDGFDLQHEVKIQKTLALTSRTIVHRKPRQYRANFEVTTEKSFEIEQFLNDYRGNKLQFVYDLWSVEGYVDNSTFDLIAQARWSPVREKITFELRINEASN